MAISYTLLNVMNLLTFLQGYVEKIFNVLQLDKYMIEKNTLFF